MKLNPITVMFVLLFIRTTNAETIRVPWDFLTIQAAINAAADGDTVLVADGTYRGDGNRDIRFKGKAILVRSENGAEKCIVDSEGSSAYQHNGFNFRMKEDENSVLQGFTVIGGLDQDGSGIFCDSASPTIIDCIIANNQSLNRGGAFFKDSSARLINCTFTENTSVYGGGVFVKGNKKISISGCTFSQNRAKYGGAVYSSDEGNSIEINHCVFDENISSIDGGAVYLSSPGLVTSCNVSRNKALRGGGFYVNSSYECFIGGAEGSGITFESNLAAGGADLAASKDSLYIVQAQYNIFSGYCYSDYFVSPVDQFNLSNCTSATIPIEQDVYVSVTGDDNNDGLTTESPFKTIRKALMSVVGNPDQPVTIHVAPGTYSRSKTGESYPLPLLDHVSIAGQNSDTVIIDADAAEAFFVGFNDESSLSNLTLKNVRNTDAFGALLLLNSQFYVYGCNFSDNGSNHYGILNIVNSTGIISNCILNNNVGVGFFISNKFALESGVEPFSIILDNVTINQNEGDGIRGDFDLDAVHCTTVSNSTISRNHGHGIFFEQLVNKNVHVVVENSIILNNGATGISTEGIQSLCVQKCHIAENGGGGIYTDADLLQMDRCLINGHNAPHNVGIHFINGGLATITNTIFSNNTGPALDGAAANLANVDCRITNCTFVNNKSSLWESSTINFSGDGFLRVKNCIFWDLTKQEIKHSFYSTHPIVSYSNIKGEYPGFMNMDTDPLFADPTDGSLRNDSPCIDAGTDFGAPEVDYHGNARPGGGEHDLGAIETSVWPTRTAVYLNMPSHLFHPGDTVSCSVTVSNPEPLDNLILFVVLDVYGSLYFAPSFSEFDFFDFDYHPGQSVQEVLPPFFWPSGTGTAEQIYFLTALSNTQFDRIYGNLDVWEFGWN